MGSARITLGRSWSEVLAVITFLERHGLPGEAENIRLVLAGCLDEVAAAAVQLPSPGGPAAAGPLPGRADSDTRARVRDHTPIRPLLAPAAYAMRTASGLLAARRRKPAELAARLSGAASARQAAHWAWAELRGAIVGISAVRPDDAHAYWCQVAVVMARLTLTVPGRHAPEQYRQLNGTLPRFADLLLGEQ